MTKVKFSYMLIIALLIGMFAVGFNAEVAFAEDSGADVELPFTPDSENDYKAGNPNDIDGDKQALSTIVNTMYTFAKYISGLIFGVSVVMIVWAGFKYATSQGETKVMEQAKMQIITAGIGIGVALFAMVIVKVFAEIYGI